MTFDETVVALERLVDQRVSVVVGHGELQRTFAGLAGMLRRAEPAFLAEKFAGDHDPPDAAFFVDGGQTGGSVPAIFLYRDQFVGLHPDDPAAGVGWAMGYTVVTVTPEER